MSQTNKVTLQKNSHGGTVEKCFYRTNSAGGRLSSYVVDVMHLESAIVSLQLPAEALQFAAGQDGLAVLIPQVVFLLYQLVLFLLQHSHLLLSITVLFQLSHTRTQI